MTTAKEVLDRLNAITAALGGPTGPDEPLAPVRANDGVRPLALNSELNVEEAAKLVDLIAGYAMEFAIQAGGFEPAFVRGMVSQAVLAGMLAAKP